MKSFTNSRVPELIFGEGAFRALPALLEKRGFKKPAVLTGGSSLRRSAAWSAFTGDLSKAGLEARFYSVNGEPSPEAVDGFAADLRGPDGKPSVDCVAALGGGSVIDAAKALSAALRSEGSVADYLEGVGTKAPTGLRLPLFAVPTTSGTGSEATKNAVLSRIGPDGFKKSLRHDNYVPDAAILDPLLMLSCPPPVTAASGLDAITQLIEAYVSPRATPFTDSIALKALEIAGRSFLAAFRRGGDAEARGGMAYAAYVSGICLANAGLGVVHGVASVLGGRFAIPHGVVCGTLIASATRYTVARAMKIDDPGEDSVLKKYARAGTAFTGKDAGSDIGNAALLVKTLDGCLLETKLPGLGAYGIGDADIRSAAAKTEAKSHPIPLSADDIYAVLKERLS